MGAVFKNMDAFDVSVQRFNEFAAEYADRFMNIDSYKDSINRFCSLSNNPKPGILELACGPGNITKYLKHRLPDSSILAVDLAPGMIEIARREVDNVEFNVLDVRDISRLPDKYDMIMCSFCLPFLSKDDTSKLISDCAGLLNEGGVLYVSTMEGDNSDAGFESTSFSGDSKVYFNYHRQQTLVDLFNFNGFLIDFIKRQDYYNPDGSIEIDMIFIGIKNNWNFRNKY